MADTTASAILSKRKIETVSHFEGRRAEVGLVTSPLTPGGAITNCNDPTPAPEPEGNARDPRVVIQEAIANQGSPGTSSFETLFSEATGRPLQK